METGNEKQWYNNLFNVSKCNTIQGNIQPAHAGGKVITAAHAFGTLVGQWTRDSVLFR